MIIDEIGKLRKWLLMGSSRSRLKDIALETGLSLSTVSRALSEKGRMSAATRQKVKDAAVRLGYAPDPMLSRLAAYRSRGGRNIEGTCLAILTDSKGELHPAGKLRIEGVRGRAHQLGYSTELFFVQEYLPTISRLAEILEARGIEGLIVDAVRNPGSYEGFPWQNFHAIAMGGGAEFLSISTVHNDIFAGIRMLWERVGEYGYDRPGLVLREEGRTESYHLALAAGKLAQSLDPPERNYIPFAEMPADPGPRDLQRLEDWLAKYRPDVVIGHTSVLENLQRLGVAVPDDVAFACYALLSTEIGDQRYAGIMVDLSRAGAFAVEFCHLELERPAAHKPGSRVLHMVEPDWQDGATLPDREVAAD